MRRISGIVLIALINIFLFMLYVPVASATSSADQQCTEAGLESDIISPATTPREQSFTPVQNRLEMVHMWVSGMGFAGDQDVVVKILNSSHAQVGTYTYAPTFVTDEPQVRTAEFNPALELTPGSTYYIQVDVQDGPNNLSWYRSAGDCYAGGTAYGEGAPLPYDFRFQTIGYTYTAPSTQTTTTTTSTTGSTSTSSTSTAATGLAAVPKTTTSSSIAVPGNPTVAYDDINKAAFFSWKASTTAGVEGYIISRSEDGTTYVDLGAVNKDTLSYSDKGVTAGKTYYYQIKAYKGTLSSPPSAAVSVAIPQAAATTAAESNADSSDKGFFTTQNIIMAGGGLLALALAVILFIIIRKRHKKNLVPKSS